MHRVEGNNRQRLSIGGYHSILGHPNYESQYQQKTKRVPTPLPTSSGIYHTNTKRVRIPKSYQAAHTTHKTTRMNQSTPTCVAHRIHFKTQKRGMMKYRYRCNPSACGSFGKTAHHPSKYEQNRLSSSEVIANVSLFLLSHWWRIYPTFDQDKTARSGQKFMTFDFFQDGSYSNAREEKLQIEEEEERSQSQQHPQLVGFCLNWCSSAKHYATPSV